VKFLQAKFLNKTFNLTNDLNHLKKYCINDTPEQVNNLQDESGVMKIEPLKDSLEISKLASSNLNMNMIKLVNLV
jgi:hypothetical protein